MLRNVCNPCDFKPLETLLAKQRDLSMPRHKQLGGIPQTHPGRLGLENYEKLIGQLHMKSEKFDGKWDIDLAIRYQLQSS